MPGPMPFLRAFLVCDRVIRDRQTDLSTLVNVFSMIMAPNFPATQGRFTAYFYAIGGDGQYPFRLSLVRVADDTLVWEWSAPAPLVFVDRRTAVECAIELANVPFPATGDYELRLFFDKRFAGLITISAQARQQGGAAA